MPRTWTARRAGVLALRMAVASSLLVWLVRESGGLRPVLSVARAARPGLVAVAFGITLLVQLLVAHRLRLLIRVQGAELGTREVLDINLVTLFYGLFLPGGGVTAIAIRFYRLSEADRRYSATLVALVWDRVLATAALCAVGIVFWILDDASRSLPALVLMLASAAALAVVVLPLFTGVPTRWLDGLVGRVPVARRIWPSLSATLATYRELPLRERLRLLALSIAAQLLGLAVYALLAGSLAIGVPLLALGWIRAVAMLLVTIPISISGLGVREGALVTLLGGHGVPGHAALAYSLLVFGVSVVAGGMVGGVLEALRWIRAARPADASRPSATRPGRAP